MKEKNKLISKLMYGKGLFIFLCVVPTFLLFATFVLYPMLSSFAMSFTDWSGMGKNYKFIGLNNYRKLIGDRTVRIALKNNLILLVFVPLVTISLSLLFASLLSGKKDP